jgi:hypothetical protein
LFCRMQSFFKGQIEMIEEPRQNARHSSLMPDTGQPNRETVWTGTINVPPQGLWAPSRSAQVAPSSKTTRENRPEHFTLPSAEAERSETPTTMPGARASSLHWNASFSIGAGSRRKPRHGSLVFEFIEGFYTPRRRHSSNGYLSPIDYSRRQSRRTPVCRRARVSQGQAVRAARKWGRPLAPLRAVARHKALAFRAAIRERKDGSAGSNKRMA